MLFIDADVALPGVAGLRTARALTARPSVCISASFGSRLICTSRILAVLRTRLIFTPLSPTLALLRHPPRISWGRWIALSVMHPYPRLADEVGIRTVIGDTHTF